MKVACLSFTDKGREIGEKISSYKEDKSMEVSHYPSSEIEGGIKKALKDIVRENDGIIFISATGIAVRMISPYIIDKTVDPAIVVVDDLARFSISLLSGHIGRGNFLCEWVGDVLKAEPIITTASDGRGIEAIDVFAMKMRYFMEDMESIKDITAMMVNGKRIGFYSEVEDIISYDNLVIINRLEDIKVLKDKIDGVICITSFKDIDVDTPYTVLRPRNLNIGIGCRKGIEGKDIIKAVLDTLDRNNLSDKSVKSIGTVEIKKYEEGIIEASKYFNCPMNIFSIGEIEKVEDRFEKSSFVKKTIGVFSVSEPSAYLSGGQIIVNKTKCNGITISISKEESYG